MVSTRRKSYQPARPERGHPTPPPAITRLRHSSLSSPSSDAPPRRGRRASSLTPLETERSSEETEPTQGQRTKALLGWYRCGTTDTLKPVEEEASVVRSEGEDVEERKNGVESAEAQSDPAAAGNILAMSAEAATESVEKAAEEEEESATKSNAKDEEYAPEEEPAEPMESSVSVETTTEPITQDEDTDKADNDLSEPLRSPESIKTTKGSNAQEEATADDASKPVEEPVSQEVEKKEASSKEVMEVDEEEVIDVETVETDDKSAEQEALARRMAAALRVLGSVTEVPSPVLTSAPTPALAAPVSTGTNAPTRLKLAPKPRGMAKSGRFWKSVRSRASKVVVRDPVSYEERMKKRQQQRVVKDLENQLKNERKQKLEDLRKRREYNAKKAEENALKAEVYQVVKNPNKIKRMKKKQLRLLQKRDTTVVGKSVLDE